MIMLKSTHEKNMKEYRAQIAKKSQEIDELTLKVERLERDLKRVGDVANGLQKELCQIEKDYHAMVATFRNIYNLLRAGGIEEIIIKTITDWNNIKE